jgi:hypothetical protein
MRGKTGLVDSSAANVQSPMTEEAFCMPAYPRRKSLDRGYGNTSSLDALAGCTNPDGPGFCNVERNTCDQRQDLLLPCVMIRDNGLPLWRWSGQCWSWERRQGNMNLVRRWRRGTVRQSSHRQKSFSQTAKKRTRTIKYSKPGRNPLRLIEQSTVI